MCVCVYLIEHIWLTHSLKICTFLRDNRANDFNIFQAILVRMMVTLYEIIDGIEFNIYMYKGIICNMDV